MPEIVGLHINKLENNPNNRHLDHMAALNSTWHTMLDPETGQAAEVKARSPHTKVLARPYVRDQDYHARYLQGNPQEAGQWAASVALSQRGRNPQADAWIVLNEPPCDTPDMLSRLAQADIAYMKALEAQGVKAGIGAFSTGNIQLPSIDSGAAVRAYEPAFRYAAANGHYLVIHCYAASRPMMGGVTPSGWVHNPRYYGLRWHEEIFPYMRSKGIPIPKVIISEFGLDLGFAKTDGGYTGQYVGYRVAPDWGYGESEAGARQYVDELMPFAAELAKDSEVQGLCIYCAGDNGDERWKSFMVDWVLPYLAAKTFPAPTTTTPPQPQPTPPPPQEPPMTLTDRLAAALRAEFGADFEDLRGKLPQTTRRDEDGNLIRYSPIDSRGFDYIAWHHSETERSRTWANIAGYHVNTNDWAGIGYHGGIRQGKVALFDSVDTERAHVYGMNHEALGWCVTGRYDTMALDERDLDAMKRVVKVCDSVYGHQKIIKGHGELRVGGYTACPGSDIKRVLPTLRQATPPPPPPVVDYAKIVWQGEDAMRAEEREGRLQNAEWIRVNWVEPAIRERDKVTT